MYSRILVFYCVLENRNIISKIKRSKVTDYAALNDLVASIVFLHFCVSMSMANSLNIFMYNI